MKVFKVQNIPSFVNELPNDDACKTYLAKIKWQDGFKCMKCDHTKGCEKAGYISLLRLQSCRKCHSKHLIS